MGARKALVLFARLRRLAPPRSKPDQTGEIHCPFSVVLTYHPDDPINAAAALRDLELRIGSSVSNRGMTPLFCVR